MEDNAIIGLYFDRDERAIEETDSKYGRFLRRISMNILSNEQDSEECVSDTYLRAWNSMPPERPNALRAFLGRITRNLSLDAYRRGIAEKRGGGETAIAIDELGECVSDGRRLDGDDGEITAVINGFLRALPEFERCVFMRRYYMSEPIAAIAKEYGTTQTRITSMLFRSRKKLRRQLEKEGIAI